MAACTSRRRAEPSAVLEAGAGIEQHHGLAGGDRPPGAQRLERRERRAALGTDVEPGPPRPPSRPGAPPASASVTGTAVPPVSRIARRHKKPPSGDGTRSPHTRVRG